MLELRLAELGLPVAETTYQAWAHPTAETNWWPPASFESPVVPGDKVWIVRAAGIVLMAGNRTAEYMMEVVKYVGKDAGGNEVWFRTPVARNVGVTSGTPVCALANVPLVLWPQEKLSVRTCPALAQQTDRLGLSMVYYILERSVFGEIVRDVNPAVLIPQAS